MTSHNAYCCENEQWHGMWDEWILFIKGLLWYVCDMSLCNSFFNVENSKSNLDTHTCEAFPYIDIHIDPAMFPLLFSRNRGGYVSCMGGWDSRWSLLPFTTNFLL